MAFEARETIVSQVLNKSIFEIPRNQRRYVWNQHNWKDLMEDILFIADSQIETPHFIGSIVLKDQGKSDGLSNYIIIDGQQRLITITLILIAILRIFQERQMQDDYEGTIDLILTKDIKNRQKSILHSDYHASICNIVEKLAEFKQEDNQTISEFVKNNIISMKKDAIISEGIGYFYNYISSAIKPSKEQEAQLLKIRDAVINMTLVCIVATSEEDSYTIFEILNARGQELEEYELLKNYVMRYIEPDGNRDLAKIKWEEIENNISPYMNKFIFHYVRHRFDIKADNNSSDYEIIRKYTKGEHKIELLDDIKKKSQYYSKLVKPTKGKDGNCLDFEYEIFSFFKTKRQEQFRPLLLSLMNLKELQKITTKEYEDTIRYLYNFFVCYTIIGEKNSNKLQDMVYKYAYTLENNYKSGISLNELLTDIKNKIPSFKSFEQSFSNIAWSNHFQDFNDNKNKRRVKVVLEIIEKYLSKKDIIDDFTIEHILPDSKSEMNSYIGNLLPIEEEINRNCKDKDFNEKVVKYSKSNFKTPRNFSERYKKDDFDVESRTKYLAKFVYKNILGLSI